MNERVTSLPAVLAGAAALVLAGAVSGTPEPPAHAHGTPHWTYAGEEGPSHWGDLSPGFSACAEGRRQSPIDIRATSPASLPKLRSDFRPAALQIAHHEHVADSLNNGHTIQVSYTPGETLTVGDATYDLVQYHFHSPSEHTIAGKSYPMEMHLVHQSASGALAVIGVLFEEGAHNGAFDPVWSNLPRAKGTQIHLEHVKVDVDALLPPTRTSYRYDGSLTTPPCSEGVKWFVMTTPVQLSAAQIAAFTALVKDNNRPVQPLNGRVVATDGIAEAPSR
jgi:carbonic anhydrase